MKPDKIKAFEDDMIALMKKHGLNCIVASAGFAEEDGIDSCQAVHGTPDDVDILVINLNGFILELQQDAEEREKMPSA